MLGLPPDISFTAMPMPRRREPKAKGLKAPRQRAKGPKPRPKAKLKAKSTDAERNIARAKVESRLAWNRDLSQDFELRIGFRNAVKPMYIQVRC